MTSQPLKTRSITRLLLPLLLFILPPPQPPTLSSPSSKVVWQGWRGTSLLSKQLFLDRIILHGIPSLPLSSPSLPLTCPLQLTRPLARRRNGQKRACVYRLCRRPFFCSSFTLRYRLFPTSRHQLRLKRQHTARLSRQPPQVNRKPYPIAGSRHLYQHTR